MRVPRVTTLSLLALFAAGLAFAQTTGSIEGTIVDETGTVLPGVTVEATSPSLQGTKIAVTDGEGRFRLVLLPPGDLRREVHPGRLRGHRSERRHGRPRPHRHPARRDAQRLQGRGRGDRRARRPSTSSPPRSASTSSRSSSATCPTGRNYTSVAQVAPGVVSTSSDDCPGCVSVYGSSGGENAYYIDGVNTTGVELGHPGQGAQLRVHPGGPGQDRRLPGRVRPCHRRPDQRHHQVRRQRVPRRRVRLLRRRLPERPRPATSSRCRRGRRRLAWSPATTARTSAPTSAATSSRTACGSSAPTTTSTTPRTTRSSRTSSSTAGPTTTSPWAATSSSATLTRDLWAGKLTWRPARTTRSSSPAFGDPTTLDGPGPGQPLSSEPTVFMRNIESGGTDVTLKYEGVHRLEPGDRRPGRPATPRRPSSRRSRLRHRRASTTAPTRSTSTPGRWSRPAASATPSAPSSGATILRADVAYFANDLARRPRVQGRREAEHLTVDNENYNSGGQRIYKFDRDGVDVLPAPLTTPTRRPPGATPTTRPRSTTRGSRTPTSSTPRPTTSPPTSRTPGGSPPP